MPRQRQSLRRKLVRLRKVVRRRTSTDARHRRELVSKLPKHGVGAEVGTWKGAFAAQLLSGAHPVRLHLIDPWESRPDAAYAGAWYAERNADSHVQEKMDAIYDSVCKLFPSEISSGRVLIHRSRSVDAAGALEALDWAYIDGDHTYEAVKADLESFYTLIRPGGVLAGDDYAKVGWWEDGVRRAVDEFAAAGNGHLTVIGSQFLIVKPRHNPTG
jgi:Methyltransferase domain